MEYQVQETVRVFIFLLKWISEFTEKFYKPADIIIIEGGELFWNKELGKMIDTKIYLDSDSDVRITKRSYFPYHQI